MKKNTKFESKSVESIANFVFQAVPIFFVSKKVPSRRPARNVKKDGRKSAWEST